MFMTERLAADRRMNKNRMAQPDLDTFVCFSAKNSSDRIFEHVLKVSGSHIIC